mmetsp:Transcript_20570/g.38840  ORF Transcript_20570/g.38840 Transcript_20570/m.38840 type:complete len:534 (+) Transcript_20570:234-1835(+)
MKQKLVVPGLFRRRNSGKTAAAAKDTGVVVDQDVRDSNIAVIFSPPLGRVSRSRRQHHAVPSTPTRVINTANSHHDTGANDVTVSTLTNNIRPEATMKMTENLLPVDDEKNSHDGSLEEVGIGHLSKREQMWYKNQIYLLDKQKRESALNTTTTTRGATSTPDRPPNRSRLSMRYESTDRGMDRYAAGIDKHSSNSNSNPKYSPKGVDEEVLFESTNMYKNVKHNCDSRKEVQQFCSTNHGRSNQDDDNDDMHSNQFSSLFEVFEDDTCTDAHTAQSSSLLGLSIMDDDTRATRTTMQSSSIFPDDEDDETRESTLDLDDVTLGSTTLGSTTFDTTLDESFMTSLDDATSASMTSSYLFELVDDDDDDDVNNNGKHGRRRRKKYQLGVGQNATTSKLRKGQVKTIAAASRSSSLLSSSKSSPNPSPSSSRRRVTVHSPRGRFSKNSADESYIFASDDTNDDVALACPLPEIIEEITGSYEDVKSSLNQVLHAFFISEDDVDRIADKVRDARLELVDMYHDQLEEGQECAFRYA